MNPPSSLFLLLWLALAACCLPSTPLAGQSVAFEALVSQRTAEVGQPFRITFKLTNADGTAFTPPTFSGFQAEGPSKGFSKTNFNGRLSSEQTYTYTLIPVREGKFTINPATIRVGGSTLSTLPIDITITPATQRTLSEADYHLLLQIDTARRYVGQGIPISVQLLSAIKVRSYQLNAIPDIAGGYLVESDVKNEPTLYTTYNGQRYASKVVYRATFYPQRSGAINIPSFTARLGIETSFFDYRVVVSRTLPLTFDIRPLPTPIPDDFAGAVGQYTLTSHLDPLQLTAGQALRWHIEVIGNGDIKRVNAPQLSLSLDTFEVYRPSITEAQYPTDAPNAITYLKTFQYLITPRLPGQYTPQVSFTYFDTDEGDYRTIRLAEQQLQVSPSTTPASLSANGGLAALQPIYTQPRLRRQTPLWGTPLFWVLFALTPLGLLGAGYARHRQGRPETPKAQHQRIRSEAQQRLQKAHTHWQADQPRDFYDAIARALLQYLSDTWQMPAHALDKATLRQRVASHYPTAPDLPQDLNALLQDCEMALYAGLDHTTAMPEVYERAQSWLDRATRYHTS